MKCILLAVTLLATSGVAHSAVTIDNQAGNGSTTDLWNGSTVTANTPVFSGFDINSAFGAVIPGAGAEQSVGTNVVFADGTAPGTATIDFTPLTGASIRKIVAHLSSDGVGNTFRSFSNVTFSGSNDGGATFTTLETALNTLTGPSRITFTFNAPQSFTSYRFEGVQPNGGGRILELDAFAAVPEPATWAFMILGFGFIGGAMRSAKRTTKVSFA